MSNVDDGIEVTIEAGEVSLEKIKLPQKEIKADTDGYVIASFDLTVNAGSDVELQEMKFINRGTADLKDVFNKVQLVVNGSKEEPATIANNLVFDDLAMTLPVGKTIRVQVIADTMKNITLGDTIKLELDTIKIEDLEEGEVLEASPDSLLFDEVTIANANVRVSKISSRDIDVVNGDTVNLIEFQVETNDLSSATLRSFDLDGTTNFSKDYVTQISLHTVDAKGAESSAIKTWNGSRISSTEIKLDGLNITIPAKSTQKFVVKTVVTSNTSFVGSFSATADSFDLRDSTNKTIANASTLTSRTINIV